MNTIQAFLKRTFDILLSAVCLVVFSPLFLYCFIIIKRDDRGPAIYSQERIGLHGKPFRILKFRSMKTDAEKDGSALLAGDNDSRLTRSGKFLRQHHLDELPQLWNVFVGDMSFVGPRPERKFYIDQIMERNPKYELLYKIRPGVTSYATLYNGYPDTMETMHHRLERDLLYLDRHSFLFVTKILLKTFTSIVFGKKI